MDGGKVAYDLVEVMACPRRLHRRRGPAHSQRDAPATRQGQGGMRTAGRRRQIRLARDNPLMGELHRQWLEKPNSQVAHQMLHTHYGHRRRIDASGDDHLPSEGLAAEVKVCVGSTCFRKGSRHLLQRFAREMAERDLETEVERRVASCSLLVRVPWWQ